jgi:hypothetical protein
MQQINPPIGRALTIAAVAASLNLSTPAPTLAADSALRAPTLHAVPDKRRIDGHVYVGDQVGTGDLNQYPVVNGVMQTTPSGTISNAYAPIALSNGELYALSSNASTFLINVYAVPSLTLERSLDIPSCGAPGTASIPAIAIAPTGNLYVLYECGIVGEGQLYGVLAYPPGAGGDQQPVQNIQICLGYTDSAWGLAVGHQGQLYVANTGLNEIQVFADPETNPKIVRTITLGYSPYQIAVDRSAGEFYVNPIYQAPIYAYPEMAHGSAQPQREIVASNNVGEGGMTILGPYLFATGGGVAQLYKRRNGNQTPIATITDRFADSVAAGS